MSKARFYKVVRKEGENDGLSAATLKSFSLNYKIGKATIPKVQGTGLLAFDNMVCARVFARSQVERSCPPLPIMSGTGKEISLGMRLTHIPDEETLKKAWRCNDVAGWPQGTVALSEFVPLCWEDK